MGFEGIGSSRSGNSPEKAPNTEEIKATLEGLLKKQPEKTPGNLSPEEEKDLADTVRQYLH